MFEVQSIHYSMTMHTIYNVYCTMYIIVTTLYIVILNLFTAYSVYTIHPGGKNFSCDQN